MTKLICLDMYVCMFVHLDTKVVCSSMHIQGAHMCVWHAGMHGASRMDTDPQDAAHNNVSAGSQGSASSLTSDLGQGVCTQHIGIMHSCVECSVCEYVSEMHAIDVY